ncbi:hypothetical protein TYRP_017159 [Tyrophagus putrescentiae]|nr:hypothetical protein TYRP_017159 [Tyrophagus putrescentiae]
MKFLIVLPAVFFLAYASHAEQHKHARSPAVSAEISAESAAAADEAEKLAIAEGEAEKRAVLSSYNSRPSNAYSVLSSSYQNSNSYSNPAPVSSYNVPSVNSPPAAPVHSSYSGSSSSNSYAGNTVGYLSVCQKRLNLLHNINKELSEAIAASQGHCASVVTLTNATAQVDILLVNSCGGSLYGAKNARNAV